MSNELLPCPFCGGEGRIMTALDHHAKAMRFCTTCTSCRADMYHWVNTEAEAIAAWNRRYVCLDKNGDKVFAGDQVKCCGAEGSIVRFGCGHVLERDGTIYQILSGEIELIKEPEDDN